MNIKIISIKIGYLTYTVKKMTKELSTAKRMYGYIDHGEQAIYIEEGLSSERYKEVLLHEIMHGVYIQWVDEDKKEEESIVTQMTNGLITVFKDNPKLKEILF